MTSFLSPVLATANIMELRPGLSIWTAITFIFLMVVLSKYAWGPIVKMLDQREQTIREAIEQAKKERGEAQKMLSDQTAALAAVQREAAAMAERSRKDVETLRADLTAKARKEADELVAGARTQIQDEKAKALAELKAQVADLAVEGARRIILSSLDEKAQRALVEEYIASLPAANKAA